MPMSPVSLDPYPGWNNQIWQKMVAILEIIDTILCDQKMMLGHPEYLTEILPYDANSAY